jgi:hypothetical protein
LRMAHLTRSMLTYWNARTRKSQWVNCSGMFWGRVHWKNSLHNSTTMAINCRQSLTGSFFSPFFCAWQ